MPKTRQILTFLYKSFTHKNLNAQANLEIKLNKILIQKAIIAKGNSNLAQN